MFLITTIVISLVLFVYFKVNQTRSSGPAEKRSYAAKSSVAAGVFLAAFGINSFAYYLTGPAAFVLLLFVAVGGANIFLGIRNFKQLKPYVEKELAANDQ
ncbi:YtpI family protein [Salisediminibacterium halotolerans]|uniref:YtpI-like protein n=1 Tax=Salisediminibacterium halotolerans TaxID=517425 RepID=A0A1H9V5J3_9BACI|nr:MULTISPECIES: YtpI family protein [Salisediminibacterium]RLJ69358.1 YtpI-like protein [Actinophytocola xinjiangensis]RPE84016.1 YtpI-like protein [Salisediminibacterium halotolerans]TWG32433.1 YtpI-like protein [Salisediminibacterium halotolerans]SES17016.1 YtpI-like protein [Salisediminibacterium haloalkalitolerans]GEL07349.1 hypothetical protein SHA02_07650 [Salisediminibacterium halotolerans]